MVIRVSIQDSDAEPTDIKAHSMVLRTTSPYFEACLRGEWTEATERRVELEVENEDGLEELKLLIKLSYTNSYTHDELGELLPISTRLGLAMWADALEFVGALDQLVASLPEGLDVEGAHKCMKRLPATVGAHAGMGAVWDKAAEVFAAHLGPVTSMFEPTAKSLRA